MRLTSWTFDRTIDRRAFGKRGELMNSCKSFRLLLCALVLLACSGAALAHIKIYPAESISGAREKYVMRVPNEKQTATVRIEGEFPANLKIYSFEAKPGWKIEMKKDAAGNVVGATWTGTLAPFEFAEFGMLAINPKDAAPLVWKFVQFYADGKTESFTGPFGSSLPAPTVTLKAADSR